MTSHVVPGTTRSPPGHSATYLQFTTELAIVLVVLGGLITGSVLHMLGADTPADVVWADAASSFSDRLSGRWRAPSPRGDVGADAIALLANATALLVGEFLAAVIVSLMLPGGNALEASANARAHLELRLLVERAPPHRAPASRRARGGGRGRGARAGRRGRRPRR